MKLPLSAEFIKLSAFVQARFESIVAAWMDLGQPLSAYYEFNGQLDAWLILELRRGRMTSGDVLGSARHFEMADVIAVAHLLMNFWNSHIVSGVGGRQLREKATTQYLNCALIILRHASGNEKVLEEITFFTLQLLENQTFGSGRSGTGRHIEAASREARIVLANLRPALAMCFKLRDAIHKRNLEDIAGQFRSCFSADPPSETLLGQWLDWVNASHFQVEKRAFLRARQDVEAVLLSAAARHEGFRGWADLLALKSKNSNRSIQINMIDQACRKLDPAILEERGRYLIEHPDVVLSTGRLGMVEYPNRLSLVFFGKMLNGKTVVLKQSYFVREAMMLDAFAREKAVYEKLDVTFVPIVYSLETIGKSKFLLSAFVRGRPLSYRLKRVTSVQAKRWSEQLMSIVLALEKRQIVHGDISTQNLLVDREGLRLIDFETASVVSVSANLASSADRQRIEQIKYMLA